MSEAKTIQREKDILRATFVAVSGGYDPIHIGHLRNIQEACKLGDRLIVILTRDDQLIEKKGYVFMAYAERKEILEGISPQEAAGFIACLDHHVDNCNKAIGACCADRIGRDK